MNLSPDELCRIAYALRVLGNISMDEDGDDVLIDKLEKIMADIILTLKTG